ncbi:hypothetical protein J2Z62_000526 [Mycoplasmoides fastidiosum]|uniref:Uncharacterized protein n=1 Tax=Mycoplasmoides fastidiosum TaxID=92758 RepID=A0ABU0LZF2_9BACT|nr:hypothetical protein [Mycoplasmoides fastidiosum]MDQ0514088.1 hypothetical protein [Mycoplasmoides fastidiosum]UUD37502.1 hypothetical protein NPA10_02950 [Mycoplasmoides fastidiosum]
MNNFLSKLHKQLHSLLHQQPDYFHVVWPDDEKLMNNAQMQPIDWSKKYFAKLLVYDNFKEILVKNNDLIVDKDLLISFHNERSNHIFLLKDALIIFENNKATIKMCSKIVEFVRPEKTSDEFFSNNQVEIGVIKKRLRKIKQNEVFGLLPSEILERNYLQSALKVKKFIDFVKMEPYLKIQEK